MFQKLRSRYYRHNEVNYILKRAVSVDIPDAQLEPADLDRNDERGNCNSLD